MNELFANGSLAEAAVSREAPSSRLNRAWRVVGTGLAFAGFGIGGLVLGLTFFPLLQALVRDRARRASLARWLIRRLFAGFVAIICAMGLCRVEVRGRERLQRQGLLILASHPSLLDVVFLMALVRDADCIVKAALMRNPFTAGAVRAAGFIFNDSGPGLVEAGVDSVRRGSNLIVFPEGTRTPARRRLGPLQRGGANIALRGGFAVTPVRIVCSQQMLGKADAWWRVPPRPGHFLIDVGEDLPVDAYRSTEPLQHALAVRRFNEELARQLGAEGPHAAA